MREHMYAYISELKSRIFESESISKANTEGAFFPPFANSVLDG